MDGTPLLGGSRDGNPRSRVALIVIILAAVIVIVAITASVTVAVKNSDYKNNNNHMNNQCPVSNYPLDYNAFFPYVPTSNVFHAAAPVLIQNATVWTGLGNVLVGYDILMENGKFVNIGRNLPPPGNGAIYNVGLAYVTPGIVDMHSHLGVYGAPEDSFGTADGNEATNPTTPYVRSIDGLDPEDPYIPLIRQGGVTSSLVLPGSANVMGGEATYVKLKGNTVSDMIIPNAPRAFKMACGENPKRVYGGQGVMPDSRMGSGWKLREKFFYAAQLKQQQDIWDCQNATSPLSTPRPQDLTLEPLIAIINGGVLNVHCYRVEDMEMMIRTSQEFGFKIAAFHHALEAWKIPDILKENNITVATFSDMWGFKMEAYEASVHAPKILFDSGVSFALKSDHPVIFARYLIQEAAIAHHFGLSEQTALQSVTIVPATAIGIGHRVGSIQVGKDADLVVWDRYPLDLGASANMVFIDGELFDNNNLPTFPPKVNATQATLQGSGPNQCGLSSTYSVIGAKIYTMDDADTIITGGQIVVQNGVITCLAQTCTLPQGGTVYTLNGGIITPGLISVGGNLGQLEVESESASQDGATSGVDNTNVKAIDGIRLNVFNARHLTEAWASGITAALSAPMSYGLIAGTGVAFNTISQSGYQRGTIVDQVLIKDGTSLHIAIGNAVKGAIPSISQQFSILRQIFNQSTNPVILSAMNQQIPVFAEVNQVDEIATLVRLKKQLGFNLTIVGGAEAYLIAPMLAAEGVSVILAPYTIPPSTFETWRASLQSAQILYQNGVHLGIGIFDPGLARRLRWEAGTAVGHGLPWYAGLKSISRNIADMLNINGFGTGSIREGTPANFVGFSGDPLSLDSTVQFVAVSSEVDCQPVHF